MAAAAGAGEGGSASSASTAAAVSLTTSSRAGGGAGGGVGASHAGLGDRGAPSPIEGCRRAPPPATTPCSLYVSMPPLSSQASSGGGKRACAWRRGMCSPRGWYTAPSVVASMLPPRPRGAPIFSGPPVAKSVTGVHSSALTVCWLGGVGAAAGPGLPRTPRTHPTSLEARPRLDGGALSTMLPTELGCTSGPSVSDPSDTALAYFWPLPFFLPLRPSLTLLTSRTMAPHRRLIDPSVSKRPSASWVVLETPSSALSTRSTNWITTKTMARRMTVCRMEPSGKALHTKPSSAPPSPPSAAASAAASSAGAGGHTASSATCSAAASASPRPSLKSRWESSSRRASPSNSTRRNPHVSASPPTEPAALLSQKAFMVTLSPPAMACSNSRDLSTSPLSVTTWWILIWGLGVASGCAGFATCPSVTRRPPNPNCAPHGRRIHTGARFIASLGPSTLLKFASRPLLVAGALQCSSSWTAILPSNEAVERMPGVRGDHCTSKFQLELAGSSARTLPSLESHTSVRLSLPQVRSSAGSAVHHAIESTPLVCPTSSLRGEMELRRSHTCRVGERSSSDATMSCVAASGFHWSAEHLRRLVGSVNEITGRWRLRSQTTVVPEVEVEARMCCTFLFHARYAISPPAGAPCCPLRAGYREGAEGLARSQMQRS
mmetsp:Transcript_26313/g.84185  ORF Transcript_26313/g.84185 Transcript_26313/m.84185 type:complete len:662 (-) Transcript_26313:135-2120(-)